MIQFYFKNIISYIKISSNTLEIAGNFVQLNPPNVKIETIKKLLKP